jgi:hypothetical protein
MLKTWQITALENIPDWFEFSETSTDKRNLLLRMAQNGEPRPDNDSKLGKTLQNYLKKTGGCYSPEFDAKIKSVRPDWFESTATKKKKQLLEMARRGDPKPSQKTKIGNAMTSYIYKDQAGYDPEFDQQIRRLAPHWFTNTATENKKLLLEMAKRGEPKPTCKTKLGQALTTYMCSKKQTYDPDFCREIKNLTPDWFVDMPAENKKLLLEMARRGDPRPVQKRSKIGRLLCNYVNKGNSYDADFSRQIRELRPDWFVNSADENKKLLLEMARNGEAKPNKRLGVVLCNYTNKKNTCYDSEFDTEIKKLRPDWFRKGPHA